MTVWVECPNCGGKVGIPDAAPTDMPCPMCKHALLTSRPLERTRRLPSDSVPSWMRPWGYAFTIIGGLAFVAGVIEEYSASRNPSMIAVIVGGLLNPIFFIGFPLGIYWVCRSKKSYPLAAIASGKPDSTVPCEELEHPLAAIASGKPDSTVPCEELEHPLAAIASGKPDSTVPCEVRDHPCKVDWVRQIKSDAINAYYKYGEFVTFVAMLAFVSLGIFFLSGIVNKSDKADGGTQQSGTGSSSHATSAQVGMRAFAVEVNEQPAVSEEETQDVIVAARDFKEEEILKPDMVRLVRVAKKNVPIGAFSSFKDIVDRWVKTAMLEGDPIVDRKLVCRQPSIDGLISGSHIRER